MPSVPATPKTLTVAPLPVARRAPARAAQRRSGPPLVWLLALPALAFAYNSVNPMLTLAAIASLAFIVGLLSRPGLPPALLFVCFMQWLQGALLVFHADLLGVEVWTLTYARNIEEATYLTLAWVVAIALGAFLVIRRLSLAEVASPFSAPVSLPRLLVAYVLWTLALPLLALVAPPQARQIMEALESLRWVLVFAIFAQGWSMQGGRMLVLGILCLEIAVGFLSFFSEFKTPLFLLAIALVSAGYRPTPRQYATLGVVFIVTLYLGIVWSSIKMDYRDQLSAGQGSASQEIVLSTEEQIDAFVGLVGTLDAATLEKGAEQLVKRIAYVEYFAYTLGYVPSVRRHEEGRIWLNAFAHVFVPRVLFPDKPPLESDTVIAERYTGILFSSGRGTSISIGLPAETYVDLGPVLMFIVPLLLGLMYGSVFRFFIIKRHAGAIAQGMAVAMHINLTSVGAASTKILGGYVSLLIIALVMWRLGWGPFSRFVRVQARS
jgi:hypothetical protein